MYKSDIRGNRIQSIDGHIWRYEDGELANYDRACIKCGKQANRDEPDPCLGMLPNVDNACCGHGINGQDYVSIAGKRMTLAEYYKTL